MTPHSPPRSHPSTAPRSTLRRVGPLALWVGALLAALAALLVLGSPLPAPGPTPGALGRAVHRDGPLHLALVLLRLGALGVVTRELVLTATAAARTAWWPAPRATAPPRLHPGPRRMRHRLVERALGRGIALSLLGACSPTLVLAAGASAAPGAVPPTSAPTSVPTSAPTSVPTSARVARMVPLDPAAGPAPISDPTPASEPADADPPVAVMVVLEDSPTPVPQPAPQRTAPPPPYTPAPSLPPAGEVDARAPQVADGDVTSDPLSTPDDTGVPAAQDTWTVSTGDHLWSIAAETLEDHWGRSPGDEEVLHYWLALTEANRDELVDPGDADLLLPGQVLHLPPVPGEVSG